MWGYGHRSCAGNDHGRNIMLAVSGEKGSPYAHMEHIETIFLPYLVPVSLYRSFVACIVQVQCGPTGPFLHVCTTHLQSTYSEDGASMITFKYSLSLSFFHKDGSHKKTPLDVLFHLSSGDLQNQSK